MVSELYYALRRGTAARASDRNLRDAAEMHRRIYQAIRARDPEAARRAMAEHLARSRAFQAEEAGEKTPDVDHPAVANDSPRAPAVSRRRRRGGRS
jgi:GntR family transcriptional repressor for pyruvate dehydrogenase complex